MDGAHETKVKHAAGGRSTSSTLWMAGKTVLGHVVGDVV